MLAAAWLISSAGLAAAAGAACPTPPPAAGGPVIAHSRFVESHLLPSVSEVGARPFTLEERMRHFGVPGVSVAVIHGGRIDWARGWGVRDADTCAAVTPRTAFQAASISKTVTAILALQQVEKGALGLDQDINRVLTSWQLPRDDGYPPGTVTLRQLLSHTAGLGVHGFPGYGVGAPLPTAVQILDGTPPANSPAVRLEVKPGREWRYSGGGYVIAELALTDLTKRPFAELADKKVFAPLGMRRSSFVQPPSAAILADAASGHSSRRTIAGKYHVYPELGAASLWTTPSDLARMLIDVQSAVAGRPARLLSHATAVEMLKPVAGGWGLGFAVPGEGPGRRFGHDGANEGFQSAMIAYVEKGEGVVVLTNGEMGKRLADEIVRAVAADYGWTELAARTVAAVAVPAETLALYAGRYEAGPLSVMVSLVGGELRARTIGPVPERLIFLTPTRFAATDSGIVAEFETGPGGAATGLRVVEGGPPLTLARAAPAPTLGSVPLFLRGTMDDWSTALPLAPKPEGSFVAIVKLQPGDHEFKIGSEDWKAADLGTADEAPLAGRADDVALMPGGANIRLTVKSAARYRFALRPAAGGGAVLAVSPLPD